MVYESIVLERILRIERSKGPTLQAYMNVMVRVNAARSEREIAKLRGQIAMLEAQSRRTSNTPMIGNTQFRVLQRYGNQLQWTGRMLQYNFTIPILLAGAAATKFALDQEKALKHVEKVYGDAGKAAKQFNKEQGLAADASYGVAKAQRVLAAEVEALDDAFTAISNHYGVQKTQVLEVAGAWAAAGLSGRDLAESVNQTMKAIIIGDIDAAKATEALIAIQGQYNLSTQELTETLATLNSVENTTGIQMAGLIDGFARAAGQARTAGVGVNELAAMLASLVPATGSAANAGNALKTIFSRLMAPTKEAVQVMNEMGLETTAMGWQGANAAERLHLMADEFENLSDSQKNVASSVIASRWQINKFSVLMDDINSKTGRYATALDAASDAGENATRMQKELNTVLESDPRKLQRMMVILQNVMADVIQPLIPFIIYLAQELGDLANAFSNLDPHVQKIVLLLLVLFAAVGPIVRYTGALITLGAVFVAVGGGAAHFGKMMLLYLGAPLWAVISASWWAGATMIGAVSGLMLKTLVVFKTGSLLVFTSLAATKLTIVKSMWLRMQVMWLFFTGSLHAITLGWSVTMGAIFAKMRVYLVGLWFATLGRIQAVTVLWRAGMIGIFGAFWVATKVIFANGAVGLATLMAAMWSGIKALTVSFYTTMLLLSATFWSKMKVVFLAGVAGLGKIMLAGVAALFSPIGIAVLAAIAVIYYFRDTLKQIFDNVTNYLGGAGVSVSEIFNDLGEGIMSVFNMLPQGVANAMIAVVTIVRDAALAVYEWFSYINPFARHSPSLVDNVEEGVNRINKKFATLRNIKSVLASAYGEIKRFGELTAKMGLSQEAVSRREDRKTIKKAGGGGAALKSYDRLIGLLNKLNPLLTRVEAKMNAQEKVVERWQFALDKANRVLDRQQDKLDKLQDRLSKYQDLLTEANDRLSYFASAPLKGMREMERAIFANQMAQTRLRDEMMKFEDVNGTFEEIESKINSINGALELLRGTQSDLRAAGAGSEILSQYDAEMDKLEQQKDKYKDAYETLARMRAELEALQRQAERLDLVKAMKFDELEFQIREAANQMKELSFEEIIAGIKTAQTDIAKYTDKVAEASAAVDAQQAVVDKLSAARDAIQRQLDREQNTLDQITDKYNEVADAISAIESAINGVVSAADSMLEALKKKKGADEYVSPGLQNFRDAKNGNFPDVAGTGIPPRTDWSSQVGDIEDFTEQLSRETAAAFESLNPFAPLKGKFRDAWEWMKDKARDYAGEVSDFFSAAFDGVRVEGGGFDNVIDGVNKVRKSLSGVAEFITQVVRDILTPIRWLWDLVGDDVKKIGKDLVGGFKEIINKVGPELRKFGPLIKPLGEAIKNAWTVAKPILGLIVAGILMVVKQVTSIIAQVIEPIFAMMAGVLSNAIQFVRGLVQIFVGIFTADVGMMIDGILNAFGGLFGVIGSVFEGGFRIILNIVEGVVRGVVGFFQWLYDVLVGHSIIPDLIDAIVAAFGILKDLAVWVWDHVLKPIVDFFKKCYDLVVAGLKLWWAGMTLAWAALKKIAGWVWDNVLKPVLDRVKDLWNLVKTALSLWWEGIKAVWNVLKTVATWLWENVLKPIFTAVKDLWTKVKDELKEWWGRIKDVWDALRTAWQWIRDKVMDPIFDAFKNGWTKIRDWFVDKKDWFLDPIQSVVNGFIKAINFIIKGINLLDKLPGVSINIGEIPEPFAAGGVPKRKVGGGFKTNGARAIVGEGKANYPEFVIPTDPTYRNRAQSLLKMAASKIGMGTGAQSSGVRGDTAEDVRKVIKNNPRGALPQFGIGGFLGDVKDAVGDTLSDVGGAIGNAAMDIAKLGFKGSMQPMMLAAKGVASGLKWDPAKQAAYGAIDLVDDWADEADKAYSPFLEKLFSKGAAGALKFAQSQVGKPYVWGGVGPDGYDCSGFMSALTNVMRGQPPHSRVGTTATFPWSGFSSTINPNGFTIGSSPSYSGGIGHMAGTINGVNVESSGGVGVRVGGSARGYMDGGFSTRASLVAGLARGGIVRRKVGGTLAAIGEGLHDEAVIPLPNDWRSGGGPGDSGDTYTYNFDNATFEFPNVTDGNDAQTFLENLVNLTKD